MSIEIFDIDGTLTTSGDTPREDLIAYLRKDREEGNRIIIVSGRPIARLAETERWLRENDVPYSEIHLQDFNEDSTPNVVEAFKAFKYSKLLEQYGDEIEYLVDNDADAREAARGMGIEAYTVAEYLAKEAEEYGEMEEEERAPINPDGYAPTAEMKNEANRGLLWRREYNRGGTQVGVSRARDIVNGRRLPFDTVQRMASYFARHEVDKQGQGFNTGEDGYPSAGRIAWALWGGDAGKRWADNIVANTERKKEPTMAIEYRQFQTEIRADGDGHTFEGYAAVFNSEAEGLNTREVIKPGAFSKSIAAAERGEWEVKALQDHDGRLFLGSTKTGTLDLVEDDRGLKVRVALNPEVSFASDLAAMLRRDGAAMGMSFGFSVPSKGDTFNSDGVRELRNVRLHEVSLLTGNQPAYPATIGLGAVRSLSERTEIDPKRLMRAFDSLLAGAPDAESADLLDLAIRKIAPEIRSPFVIGAARDLPINETREWDGAAAAQRVFALAGFDGENPQPDIARRAFLVYDAAAPELRGSYKLGFADVIDGELVAIRAGLNAAASRLPQTDIPQEVIDRARAVLDAYRPEEDAPERAIPLSVRERQLALANLEAPIR
jgi:HK97 family phage prohead protease